MACPFAANSSYRINKTLNPEQPPAWRVEEAWTTISARVAPKTRCRFLRDPPKACKILFWRQLIQRGVETKKQNSKTRRLLTRAPSSVSVDKCATSLRRQGSSIPRTAPGPSAEVSKGNSLPDTSKANPLIKPKIVRQVMVYILMHLAWDVGFFTYAAVSVVGPG